MKEGKGRGRVGGGGWVVGVKVQLVGTGGGWAGGLSTQKDSGKYDGAVA